jgi:hypothetical protein
MLEQKNNFTCDSMSVLQFIVCYFPAANEAQADFTQASFTEYYGWAKMQKGHRSLLILSVPMYGGFLMALEYH